MDGSVIATRLETKMPEEPSVNVAPKTTWPKLLKAAGQVIAGNLVKMTASAE